MMRMTSASLPTLGERQRDILAAVIHEYILTALPVASAALVQRYRLPISSATVRNELASLEEAGLLMHPHTSAGRVPTDLGYRFFIESLMAEPGLAPDEQLMVSHQFQQAQRDLAEWMRLAASTLARLTAEAAIVTPPAAERTTLRHIEVIPITGARVLLVAVLEGGAVRQQLLELERIVATEELRVLSARLSDQLAGANGPRVREAFAHERGVAAEVIGALADLLDEHDNVRSREIYYDGFQNIIAQPEFASSDRIRDMLGLLEDRTRLATVLPPALADDQVLVSIGSEHHLEPLADCSLVFGRYGAGTAFIGYIGIVGPTRMDYARSIGAVRYVGGLMSDLLRVVEGTWT